MKTALLFLQPGALLDGVRAGIREFGYNGVVVGAPDELLDALRQEAPAVTLSETRRDSFADLLRTMVRLRPAMPVYLMEAGTVFCRYPMRSQQPDFVEALRSAGIRLPDRMLMPGSIGKPKAAEGAILV